uniref:Fucose-1-phosphate guanylyltransferase n=1 Tax=Malurus cyaneus samueli TaxID=2593467 RepID=A0A8C5T8W6_9PASS
RFAALRGAAARPGQLWDAVLLTAADTAQAGAFREQLEEKLRRGELPRGIRYLVCADPPGPRIGNGGSTLHALRCLEEQFGDQWTSFTVLLIHSGKFSFTFFAVKLYRFFVSGVIQWLTGFGHKADLLWGLVYNQAERFLMLLCSGEIAA